MFLFGGLNGNNFSYHGGLSPTKLFSFERTFNKDLGLPCCHVFDVFVLV